MLHQLRTRLVERGNGARERGEEGFTLIELMVVVLIIAILIAIAIPTFLGARQKAQDRAAQSNLRNALTAAKTAYVDSQNYQTDVSSTAYASIEPSLNFVYGAATTGKSNDVSVSAPGADTLVLAAHSASGQCYYIKDVATGGAGTGYAKGPDSSGKCDASSPPGTFGPSW